MIAFFTVTGRQLDLSLPRPIDVSVEDIFCGLSKICRYNGQIASFYSVAQHACLVAELVDPHLAFPALNHDDSEAYVGDMSSKLKHSPFMDYYRSLEQDWTNVIEIALGLQSLTPEERHQIKVADDLAAIYERVLLRYNRDFKLEDIQTAVSEQWITRSSVEEMTRLAGRLPSFMTPVSHDVARCRFAVHFARTCATWRGKHESLIVRVS